ncbi:MAG TPA: hypothetical protein VFR67_12095 [Pilimelia sp.]|nr:hypothetical protein [Pilimelia sp.]
MNDLIARWPPEPVTGRPWSLLVVPIPVAVACAGLVVRGTTLLYDVIHWGDTLAAAHGYGALPSDTPAAEDEYRLRFLVFLVGFGIALAALAGLTAAVLLRSGTARVLLCLAAPASLLLCFAPTAVRDETFPLWLFAAETIGSLLVLVSTPLIPILLLLSPTRRYFNDSA